MPFPAAQDALVKETAAETWRQALPFSTSSTAGTEVPWHHPGALNRYCVSVPWSPGRLPGSSSNCGICQVLPALEAVQSKTSSCQLPIRPSERQGRLGIGESRVEFFTHCSLLAYFTQTKPLAPLPEVLPAAGHLVHSLTVVVGAGDEGWLFTTELEPCFTHWNLLPTFLQTNFVMETTFTALTLVQLPDAWAGDTAKVPKRNASTKVIEANRLAEVNLAESAVQELLSFLSVSCMLAPASLSSKSAKSNPGF
jgi:hypothetical protein